MNRALMKRGLIKGAGLCALMLASAASPAQAQQIYSKARGVAAGDAAAVRPYPAPEAIFYAPRFVGTAPILSYLPGVDQTAPQIAMATTIAAAPKPDLAPVAQSVTPRSQGEILADTTEGDWITPDPDNLVYLSVPHGTIVVALSEDLAQDHAEQVRTLVGEGFFDGLDFYRVIEGFVAQGGDESGEKDKGSAADSLEAEFEEPIPGGLAFTPLGNDDGYAPQAGYINGFPAGMDEAGGTVWLAHCAGAFAFARDTGRDTASTEFYITLQPQRYLDRNLTVVGRVIWGMDVVQAITRGAPGNGGVIEDKDDWTPIVSARLGSDVPPEERLDLEMLDTNSDAFAELIEARRNRPEDFFYVRHDYIGLCQMPLPVREKPAVTEGPDE